MDCNKDDIEMVHIVGKEKRDAFLYTAYATLIGPVFVKTHWHYSYN
jgi:hypothetical protein